MAFNWSVFRTRAFTALLFVTIMAIGLLAGNKLFLMLISVIHFGCWKEYVQLIRKIYHAPIHPLSALGFSLLGYHIVLLFADFPLWGYQVSGSFSLPVLAAGCVLLILGIFKQRSVNVKAFFAVGLGLVYISASIALFLDLRLNSVFFIREGDQLWGKGSGFYMSIIIILATWTNDTMAYLVGSAVGRTPFSSLSPKKTLEGLIGGMILCVVAVTLVCKPFFDWKILFGISLSAAIFGTLGDLLESAIKRKAGVKDSGHIMPGHGGFLDRFDSLLTTTPFVWLFLGFWFEV